MRVAGAGDFRTVFTLGWRKPLNITCKWAFEVLAEDGITKAENNYSKRISRNTQARPRVGCQRVAIRSVSLEL
jgi:hypothetical protein